MGVEGKKRVLRIGIIQGGKIVEERLIRRRESITIGQGSRNTFIIPIPQLPKSYTLFEIRSDRYHLVYDETMEGRVSLAEGIVDLAASARSGSTRQRGGLYVLELDDDCRGKVVIGDVTLLFQFVDAPPVMPRPQLPAAARGQRMDWTLAYLLMLSFVFQGGAGIGLDIWWRVEGQYLEDPIIARANQRYQLLKSMAKDKEKKEEEKKKEEKDEKEDKDTKDDDRKNDERVVEPEVKPRKVIRKKSPSGKSDLKALDRAVSKKTVMGVLTAVGGEGTALNNVLEGGFKELEGAFEGTTIDTDANADLNSGYVGPDSASKKSEDLKNITRKSGPLTKDRTFARTDRGPEIRISVRSGKVSGKGGMGDIDSAEVSRRIRRRSSAVKACYERALRSNPKLKGKLAIRFTITNSGRVGSNVKVRTNQTNSAVSSCIISKLKNWRFPQPKKGTVSFNYTWVFSGR